MGLVVLGTTAMMQFGRTDHGSLRSAGMANIVDESGVEVAEGGAPFNDLLCLPEGTYTINGYDSYGDGWNGNVLTIFDSEGYLAVEFTFDDSEDYPECQNPEAVESGTDGYGECTHCQLI